MNALCIHSQWLKLTIHGLYFSFGWQAEQQKLNRFPHPHLRCGGRILPWCAIVFWDFLTVETHRAAAADWVTIIRQGSCTEVTPLTKHKGYTLYYRLFLMFAVKPAWVDCSHISAFATIAPLAHGRNNLLLFILGILLTEKCSVKTLPFTCACIHRHKIRIHPLVVDSVAI